MSRWEKGFILLFLVFILLLAGFGNLMMDYEILNSRVGRAVSSSFGCYTTGLEGVRTALHEFRLTIRLMVEENLSFEELGVKYPEKYGALLSYLSSSELLASAAVSCSDSIGLKYEEKDAALKNLAESLQSLSSRLREVVSSGSGGCVVTLSGELQKFVLLDDELAAIQGYSDPSSVPDERIDSAVSLANELDSLVESCLS